ncbi:MAG: GNAT family N-acetyltransferase [Gemmatimonadales bacterium]
MAAETAPPVGPPVLGWSRRPLPPRSPMVGRWCRLEPLDPARHASSLFAAFRSDTEGRGWTYLPYGPFANEAAFREWLDGVAGTDDPLFHTISDEHGEPVGVASFLRITPDAGSIEVGHIHYAPRLQRTRAATETMYLMMRRAFDELGYRRYEWKCDALNAPSRRAAERLGFTYEGTFRQHVVTKGRNRDTAWYSIIDAEWPAIRAAFEAWLDPANFDERGKQRRSLEALRASTARS